MNVIAKGGVVVKIENLIIDCAKLSACPKNENESGKTRKERRSGNNYMIKKGRKSGKNTNEGKSKTMKMRVTRMTGISNGGNIQDERCK